MALATTFKTDAEPGLARRVSRKNFAFAIKFIPTYSAFLLNFSNLATLYVQGNVQGK